MPRHGGGGVPCGELLQLEVAFLFMSAFELYVSVAELTEFSAHGQARGRAMHASACACAAAAQPHQRRPKAARPRGVQFQLPCRGLLLRARP
eukprot:TRINITY_DN750_c0_g1_i13.p3 TRINITY_DN750_c0_g1~~TRINITY_DN750_c0_g1_i13.p3  ORF type:complete len:107 (-),score=7.50 TRINITY_DN750_c0_g1_i13:27-302(-)